MNKPTPSGNRRVWIIAAAAAVLLVLLAAGCTGGLIVLKRATRKANLPTTSFLDQTLGLDTMDGVEEEGFHGHEVSPTVWPGESYRWTDGAAKLVIPLTEAPQSVHVRLGLTVGRTVALRIRINGQFVFDERVAMTKDWLRTFDLTEMDLGKQVVLEILSDTVVPAESHKNSTDPRTLGVAVRGITLFGAARSFLDMPLGVRAVPGVAEEGFQWDEQSGGQPCRWTNGAARLIVPVSGQAPRWLALTIDCPSHPDPRVQVIVNGRKLGDEMIQPRTEWVAELPLDGLDLSKAAQIEIRSPSFVPAQTIPGSTDGRKLGARVKRIALVQHAAAK